MQCDRSPQHRRETQSRCPPYAVGGAVLVYPKVSHEQFPLTARAVKLTALAVAASIEALVLADKSGDATGKLPPSSCKQDSATHVTCTGPAAGVSGVVFATYSSLKAMYAAYTAKVTALNSDQFRQNFSDCGAQGTYGEVGWNHLFQHTKAYSVDQMTMGMVKDDQAARRVFCNYTQGLEYMVWTQNDGRLMGYVAGPVHTNVWDWWVAVHHNIGIGGAPMNM